MSQSKVQPDVQSDGTEQKSVKDRVRELNDILSARKESTREEHVLIYRNRYAQKDACQAEQNQLNAPKQLNARTPLENHPIYNPPKDYYDPKTWQEGDETEKRLHGGFLPKLVKDNLYYKTKNIIKKQNVTLENKF